MRRSSLSSVVALAALATTGCKPKPIPIQAELVEVSSEAIAIRVTSEPGVRVELSNHVREGGGTLVPPEGSVVLTYPRASWAGYSGSTMDVAAGKKGFGKDRWGTTRLELPVPVASLLLLPEGKGGGALLHGVRAMGEGAVWLHRFGAGSTTHHPRLGTKQAPDLYWATREASLAVVVGSPKGTKVTLGSVTRDAEPTGLTRIDLPSSDVVGAMRMESIAQKEQTIELPLVVVASGTPSASTVSFHPTQRSDERAPWLAEHVDRLAGGALAPATPVDAVLWRTSRGEVVHVGANGFVRDARFVALETVETRAGEACRYGTFSLKTRYEDVTLHVHDTRTGAEVAKATFRSPPAACALYEVKTKDKERTYRADDTTFTGWLGKGLAKAFR